MRYLRVGLNNINYSKMIGIGIVLLLIGIQTEVLAGTSEEIGSDNYLLVTGFEPFYVYDVNPSQLIVEALNGTLIGNTTVIGIVLPVNFSGSVYQITSVIDKYDPLLVVSLGLNGEARMIQVENIGVNIRKRPRNNPFWFLPKRLDPDGPFLLKTTLPTNKIVSAIRDEGISVRHSFHAGTYVCNAVFYQTLRFIKEEDRQIPMGFIHVPPLDYQEPHGMNLSYLLDAIDIVLSMSLNF
jgi:pyroglutamyl-peptidase